MSKEHRAELSHLLPRRRGEQFGGELKFEMIFYFNSGEWHLVQLRTATCVSRRTSLATLLWKSVFCFHSRTLSKIFVIALARCFRQIFQNWILCVQKNKLRKKLSYGKFRYHSFLPDFERWLSVTFGKKNFRGDCQKYLLRVQRNFLEKTTLWKFSYRWLLLEFERKPFGTILKLLLRVQWNSVRKLYFLRKIKLFVVSTHYVKLYRTFKRYWQDCQVIIYHLQWNILRKK